MKRALLIFTFAFIALSIVLPTRYLPAAQAQKPPTQVQKNAVEQWAKVLRSGQTPKAMYQAANLLQEAMDRVEAQHDQLKSMVFLYSLRYLHKGATLRAQGLKRRRHSLLNDAEAMIHLAGQLINGRVTYMVALYPDGFAFSR